MDRKLFEEGSAVLERQKEYAYKMEELHIIVFSLAKHNLQAKKINNLYIYPTNSRSRISFLFDAYRIGKKIIIAHNFSPKSGVVSAQDPMGIVGFIISRRFKLPLQLQIHTDIFNPYFRNSLTNWLNFWYSGWVHVPLAKFLIPRAEGLRVVNSTIMDSIKKRFPDLKANPDVLPVFVDTEKILNSLTKADIKKDLPQFESVILMASRLTKEKRIDIALYAMKKVIVQFPEAGLVICGTGGERNNLELLVKRLGLTKNIVFLGWRADLISLYKTADIFLLTSEYEGYGMTLLEAGASGCPIVTTKVGLADTNLFKDNENSLICPVGDIDCISQKLMLFISDRSRLELFKQRMQDSIKKLAVSKEQYVANYVGLLESILKINSNKKNV